MTANRIPPHDRQTERALIGACILRPQMIDEVAETVTADDFYVPAHANLWQTVIDTRQTGDAVDALTVAARYQDRHGPMIADRPAVQTIADLTADTPSTSNAPTYAQRVADLAVRRRAIAVAHDLAEQAYSPDPDTEQLLTWAAQAVTDLAQTRNTTGPVPVIEALNEWAQLEHEYMTGPGQQQGVPTGLTDLDRLLLGLRPGQLVTIGARPAMGKTALGLQWAVHAAQHGHPTLVVSAEMSVGELAQRLVTSGSHVDLQRIRAHQYYPGDWDRIEHTFDTYRQTPMWILDDGAATVNTIRNHARRVPQLALVVVDYLQLLTPARRGDNRQIDVGEIATGLKRLARELHVPVVALAQLNRQLEQRADKRPMLADLRESGNIEADSDIVIGLYRDEVYDPDTAAGGTAEIIVLKHRNGPTGTVQVAYLAHNVRFENMARHSSTGDRP